MTQSDLCFRNSSLLQCRRQLVAGGQQKGSGRSLSEMTTVAWTGVVVAGVGSGQVCMVFRV